MILESAPVEPIPIDAAATTVLVASLVITALWLVYLYR